MQLSANITREDLITQILKTMPSRWQSNKFFEEGIMMRVNNVFEWDLIMLKEIDDREYLLQILEKSTQ